MLHRGKILPAGSNKFLDGTEPSEQDWEELDAAAKRIWPKQFDQREQIRAAEVQSTAKETVTDELPADFPGFEALQRAGKATYTSLREMEPKDIAKIEGVNNQTALAITKALKSHKESE